MRKLPRVFNFSGGESSALMVLISNPTPDDIILFADTGREAPGTYQFIRDFEKREGLIIHKAGWRRPPEWEMGTVDIMKEYLATQTMVPNRTKRICTEILKIRTAKRWIRVNRGWIAFENYIGFRWDEILRVSNYESIYKRVEPIFPLYNNRITKPMVNDYWSNKPYRLNIPRILGNCDLCFLKGKTAIVKILRQYPELAQRWIDDENRIGSTFIKDYSYTELLDIAKRSPELWPLENLEREFPCSCTT